MAELKGYEALMEARGGGRKPKVAAVNLGAKVDVVVEVEVGEEEDDGSGVMPPGWLRAGPGARGYCATRGSGVSGGQPSRQAAGAEIEGRREAVHGVRGEGRHVRSDDLSHEFGEEKLSRLRSFAPIFARATEKVCYLAAGRYPASSNLDSSNLARK